MRIPSFLASGLRGEENRLQARRVDPCRLDALGLGERPRHRQERGRHVRHPDRRHPVQRLRSSTTTSNRSASSPPPTTTRRRVRDRRGRARQAGLHLGRASGRDHRSSPPPSPIAMNSTGRSARGRTIEATATKVRGARRSPTRGRRRARSRAGRPRLADVSASIRSSPDRGSGVGAMRWTPSGSREKAGSSLSAGFADRRGRQAGMSEASA